MIQTIHLNSNSFRLFPLVYMVQNDTGRELEMILDDFTLSGSETGTVAIKRSDGSYYTISATLVIADNAFTADMTQALTQPGQTECQLKVNSSSEVVSTYTFIIFVQESTDGISEAQLGYSVQQLQADVAYIKAGGMPLSLRLALLQIAKKVAYIDDQGATYYQDLYDALQPDVTVVSISCTYTQSGPVYDTDTLESLKDNLVVTALFSDSSTDTVPSSSYTLSGTLEVGTSTVTVTYEGKTTTFTVNVSAFIIATFEDGAIAKQGAGCMKISATARARMTEPVPNQNYVFTVTDATKYALCAYDITSDEPSGLYYPCGNKTIAWATTDSVTTAFVWLALKKNDNTNFTEAELANGAEAVFTFTRS